MLLQLVKFGLVGIIATLVDVGILAVLREFLYVDVLIASVISFCVSVTVNYILSMAFVFKGKNQNKLKELSMFILLSIGGLGLNELILWMGVRFSSAHYMVPKFLAIVVVPIYNFITRKIFLESKEK